MIYILFIYVALMATNPGVSDCPFLSLKGNGSESAKAARNLVCADGDIMNIKNKLYTLSYFLGLGLGLILSFRAAWSYFNQHAVNFK